MNKKLINSRCVRVIVLSYLFFGLMHVTKAQDEITVSPLTAQQFEHCEGDLFYVDFSRYAVMTHWDERVFSALQHKNPVKSIRTKYYEERMVYDEPTMVEDQKYNFTFDYNGDCFVSKGQRVWRTDGITAWFRSYNPYVVDLLVFEANNQNKKGGITYDRDEKNRVKRVKSTDAIIDYTYWANTDYIHTIKCYGAIDGKMMAEVQYDYLTTSKKHLLKEATCKTYRRSSPQKTYIYRLNYNAAMDVNRVDLYFEDQGDFKEKVEESIDVKIERDKKGNITKCACTLVKYVNDNVDELRKGYVRNASWQFTYDSNDNWTTMTKTQNFNGTKTKQQIKRELIFDTSQGADSKAKAKTNKPQPAKEFSGEVYQIVEEMPEFPGGMQKLMEFLSNNIQYPQVAREEGIQGRVFVGFIVEPDGSISNVKVQRGIGSGCDEEAVRVIKSMPKWEPGKQRGQAVRVSYQIPINFRLTN